MIGLTKVAKFSTMSGQTGENKEQKKPRRVGAFFIILIRVRLQRCE